jgi:hypothetical protein
MITEVLVVPSFFRPSLAILAAALLMTSIAFAFSAPLSDEAVREAYFLGQRRDDRTAQFLETYRRYFPVPESGPHVFVVELFTPYAQAVEASSKHGAGLSAQQARQDYQARGDSLRVGVYVRYTSTYGPGFPYSPDKVPGQTGTWKDFQIRLMLNGETLCSRPTGFIVWQEYDASNLASTDATIEIDTPDGQHVVAPFDLSRLR